MWTHLSRTGGASAPEARRVPARDDRRLVRERIKEAKGESTKVAEQRRTATRARDPRSPTVAIVAIPTAGQSRPCLNSLVGSEVRKGRGTGSSRQSMTPPRARSSGRGPDRESSTDTVGFNHNCPTSLSNAFRAHPLEEVTHAPTCCSRSSTPPTRHFAEQPGHRSQTRSLEELGRRQQAAPGGVQQGGI